MSRQTPRRKVLAWSGLLAAAVVVVVAAVYVIFWPVSDLIARHDVGAVTGQGYGAALQAARDAARGRLVAFGAGLFAAGALVFTARNFILSREGQVTDRYTKAIEQLGSDKLDVRIGGIYALERVARDSAKDHPTVMEVLTAFIRDQSREPWPTSDSGAQEGPRSTRPDVQAAITVVGRRNAKRDLLPVDFAGVHLTGAILWRADLALASLAGADLTRANLREAVLTAAVLRDADLAGANLDGADLRDADLAGANLTNAVLTGASLRMANLTNARLVGANLSLDLYGVNLTAADLYGADLTGADLTDANLAGAYLTNADLDGADLTRADLTRATPAGAGLAGAGLAGANLTDVRWPGEIPAPDGWIADSESGRLKRAGGLSEVTAHYP